MRELQPATPFYRFLVAVSNPVVRSLFRLQALGLDNVPASDGFVLAANHVSNFDPWPLGLPLYPRQLHFMAKVELYNPVLKPFLDAGGAFPVRRGTRDPESFRTAVRLARAGGVIAMFPEGTRRRKGLKKRHQALPHPGAARIALAAGVPLVPAAIAGTDRLSRLGPIRVAYGPPVELGTNGAARRTAAEQATERLMAAIADLEATV